MTVSEHIRATEIRKGDVIGSHRFDSSRLPVKAVREVQGSVVVDYSTHEWERFSPTQFVQRFGKHIDGE